MGGQPDHLTRLWRRAVDVEIGVRSRAALAGLLLAVVTACGEDGTSTRPDSDRSSTATTSAPTSTSTGGMPRLGLSDDGTTVTLQVDGNASITLTGGMSWGEPAVTGAAVTLSEDISDAETSGRSWTVIAREPGEATVTVTGSPTCRSETPPCQAPDRSWSVRFVVE